jgi:hypothetical protein
VCSVYPISPLSIMGCVSLFCYILFRLSCLSVDLSVGNDFGSMVS